MFMIKADQITLDHLLIQQGALFTGTLMVPSLSSIEDVPDMENCIPINLAIKAGGVGHWGHCFVKDELQNKYWNSPYAYIPTLKNLEGVIGPDFSLYRDYSLERQQWNCYRNRVIAYHWQKNGINVIPTASWSTPDSFEWCWQGLPSNSALAITTNGIVSEKEGTRLFIIGLDELIQRKNPHSLIVCGHFFPWMQEKYPQVRMIRIKSYGQIWNERKKAMR